MNLNKLNRFLFALAAAILLTIIIVTIAFYIFTKENPASAYRKSDPSPKKITNMNTGKEKSMNAFTDIGQLRIFTKQISEKDEQVVIVVSPWFSYPAEDKALFVELSLKERQIKSIFTNYFSALTFSQIRAKGENLIKEELLQKINENLVMGQIRAVYFNDYIFIE